MKTTVHDSRPRIPGRLIAAALLLLLGSVFCLFAVFWGVAPAAVAPLLVFGVPAYLLIKQSRSRRDATEEPIYEYQPKPKVTDLTDERNVHV